METTVWQNLTSLRMFMHYSKVDKQPQLLSLTVQFIINGSKYMEPSCSCNGICDLETIIADKLHVSMQPLHVVRRKVLIGSGRNMIKEQTLWCFAECVQFLFAEITSGSKGSMSITFRCTGKCFSFSPTSGVGKSTPHMQSTPHLQCLLWRPNFGLNRVLFFWDW